MCAAERVLYLEEIFDLRVVISFLLNQRGSVQLTRTESDQAEDFNKQLPKVRDQVRIYCNFT